MKKPIISIVVPVYNRAHLIGRTLDSLLPQLSEKVELVLVNDGSTDDTAKVLDECAKNHEYVRVVHKENGGVSSARNAGIKIAQGEYLSFVDSDDRMKENSYEKLLEIIETYHPDMIDFGWTYFGAFGDANDSIHKVEKEKLLDKNYVHTKIIPAIINLVEDKNYHIYPFSCTKLFQAKIVKENCVFFDETRRVWEDQPFVVEYLQHINTFYSMNECLYCYMQTSGSLSSRYTNDFFRIIIENYKLYKVLFGEEYNFDTQYVYDYWSNSIQNMIFRSFEETNDAEKIEKTILETLRDPQVIEWFSKRTNKTKREKAVSRAITEAGAEKALSLLKNQFSEAKNLERNSRFKQKLKNFIKRILRKEKIK